MLARNRSRIVDAQRAKYTFRVQRDAFSCGAVAVMNAFVWSGVPLHDRRAPRKRQVTRALDTQYLHASDAFGGTRPETLTGMLVADPHWRRVVPAIDDTDEFKRHLDAGRGLIVLYSFWSACTPEMARESYNNAFRTVKTGGLEIAGAHYIFVYRDADSGAYCAVNDVCDRTEEFTDVLAYPTWRGMCAKLFTANPSDRWGTYPRAWVVEPRNNTQKNVPR